MVEKNQIVVLFKIKKIDNNLEELIPFEAVEGEYDFESNTFKTSDGTIYLYIENTEIPNLGFAYRKDIDVEKCYFKEEEFDINKLKDKLLNLANKYRYTRTTTNKKHIIKTTKENNYSERFIEKEGSFIKEMSSNQDNETPDKKSYDYGYTRIGMTPKDIVEKVKKTIKGQDKAIETIVTCLWATINCRNISKKQMILIGPTGVGKTAIFKKLQEILNIPVTIFSVPGLSQAGYEGRSTDEILKQIYFENDEDIDMAEHSIVILDEFDKIAFDGNNKSGDISTIGVQNELLKMVEGYKRVVEINNGEDTFEIDTSKIIFIATGAFQELYDDKKKSVGFCNNNQQEKKIEINAEKLVEYGLKKEAVGRFPIIIELNALTREIYREIILESDESELLSHVQFLESLGVTVSNLEELIDSIIDDAMSKEIGARGLIATISKLFLKIIYEIANNPNKYSSVTLGKNILADPDDFILTKKSTNKKVRKKSN